VIQYLVVKKNKPRTGNGEDTKKTEKEQLQLMATKKAGKGGAKKGGGKKGAKGGGKKGGKKGGSKKR
jgi:hypothetical protein